MSLDMFCLIRRSVSCPRMTSTRCPWRTISASRRAFQADLCGDRARLSGTYLAMHQEALTAVFLLVKGLSMLVGDTGFEPVTSSVSEDTFATTSAGSAERSRMNRQASTICVG
jgi:hypothetical protein